jgi:hypothetical protein
VAARDPRQGPRTRGRAEPGGRRVPVAVDRRCRVLRVLAGRDGRVPRVGGRLGRGGPLPVGDRGRGLRTRVRRGDPGGDRAAVALARPPRRPRRVPHRRRHRARRVHGGGGQQRLHEPDGAAEPARGRGRSASPSTPGGTSRTPRPRTTRCC